jgi:DNA-binding IscR family transcriptional regulator
MYVTAKADYAVRAVVELASSSRTSRHTIKDLARAQDIPPEEVSYNGATKSLQDVWLALRASVRAVLELVTVADIASGRLPEQIIALSRQDDKLLPG